MIAEGAATPVRVFIVDDHPVVREGLRTILQQLDVAVVGEAGSGSQAVDEVVAIRPDVVLMDIRMPDMDGLTATQAIRQAAPDVAVIILTSFPDSEYLRRALAAGALGFLLKGIAAPALAHAVRLAKDGVCTLDAGVMAELAASTARTDEEAGLHQLLERLSPRETEVLSLLELGYSNRAIAAHIHYSVATVKATVQHILAKLEVKSRAQAAHLASRAGLTPPVPSE